MKAEKFLKVGAVSPRIRLADVDYNVEACIKEANRAAGMGVRVLVFPKLTVTGASCQDLFLHTSFCDEAERGLERFIDCTKELDIISFIGLPVEIDDAVYSCTAVVYMGELLAVVPDMDVDSSLDGPFSIPEDEFYGIELAGRVTDFVVEPVFEAPFDKSVKIEICSDYVDKASNIVVCPMSSADVIGKRRDRLQCLALTSGRDDRTYVYANAGIGESTTDYVYSANNIIADRGEILAEALPFAEDNLITADVRIAKPAYKEAYNEKFEAMLNDKYAFSVLPKNPFLPEGEDEAAEACREALEIQAQALAARVQRAYARTMVIGVSGGLDSTLALLVCARAADILGMDRKSIIGVTMPCFGTTKRTKSNAEKLCEELGTTLRVVDIKASVTQHLHDIGHDGETPDVTFENAQARERTQVIMDISNMTGGLVVGTGDLSELVLGWATYNGDHMSMYSVNGSVPKTMVRRITEVYSADHRGEGEVSLLLDDILATPVSPELLPPKDDEIAQCTEALVGPYELHDFFIYCILECKLSIRDTYECAVDSLGGVYDKQTILGWLRVFVRRFFSQQFKRSCLPDGPKVSCISVSPRCGLHMPSDASAAVWQRELDEIEKEEK